MGSFYGFGMLLWTGYKRKAKNIKPVITVGDGALWLLGGLLFGLLTTFGWLRTFRPPLLFLSIAALAGILIIVRFGRPKTMSSSS
jgi:hypothetical protein